MNDSQKNLRKSPEPRRLQLSFGWIEVTEFVLAGSRPMLDWEREALDEFTWAEFEA